MTYMLDGRQYIAVAVGGEPPAFVNRRDDLLGRHPDASPLSTALPESLHGQLPSLTILTPRRNQMRDGLAVTCDRDRLAVLYGPQELCQVRLGLGCGNVPHGTGHSDRAGYRERPPTVSCDTSRALKQRYGKLANDVANTPAGTVHRPLDGSAPLPGGSDGDGRGLPGSGLGAGGEKR